MPVKVFYKQQTEATRIVEEYLHDFRQRTGGELEIVDPGSPDGANLCRIYDVVEYPTVVATTADGQLRNMWRGLPLPTIDEVSFYV